MGPTTAPSFPECPAAGRRPCECWAVVPADRVMGVGRGAQADRLHLPASGAAAVSWQDSQGGCLPLHLTVGIPASPLAEIARASVTCKQMGLLPQQNGTGTGWVEAHGGGGHTGFGGWVALGF